MNNIQNLLQSFLGIIGDPLRGILGAVVDYMPTLLAALVLLLVGRLIASVVERLVSGALGVGPMKKLFESVDMAELLGFVGITKAFNEVFGRLVYWVIVLFFATSAFDVLGLEVLVSTLQDFIAFLPSIFLAAVVMIVAFVISRMVKSAVLSSLRSLDVSFGGVLATAAQIIVIYFGAIVAAEKLRFDVDVISSNASYVIIGIIGIIVISLGFGTRIPAANLIASYYVKQLYSVGDKVTLDGMTGEVVAINNIAVVLRTDNGDKHVPNKMVLEYGSSKHSA